MQEKVSTVDKPILEQYTDLQAEERDLVRRIQSISAKLSNMTIGSYMVADSVTCGKKGKKPLGSKRIEGFPYPEYQKKKNSLKTYELQLRLADEKLLELLTQVEEYIEGIENGRMRRIMRYRYIDDLSWVQVAHRMGGYHTADSCRKAHDRFLEE